MLAAPLAGFASAQHEGWPANYEGVMLQGFYWDSFSETQWTALEAQADELSEYFDLIWVPNSARCGSTYNQMGYMPVYWFDHTSSFGNVTQLRSMIKAFKERGTGIIEDVVINHRNGVSNWWNFPAENYRGTSYQLTNGSITSNDEMWSSSDGGATSCPASYKGNKDTGDNFEGARDLDHTNQSVQNNIKAYLDFLINDLGYAGFRYDMVKGYGGQYTKIYNESSKPKFSVGEYWDNYDNTSNWIKATDYTSAAFDFAAKDQINKAFKGGLNLTELVWQDQVNNKPQPAGLIHYGYQQYAVTFVDNHDTYRDNNKMSNDAYVPAANAFILSSPGTPCVFLPHWTQYKAEIKKMIEARKAAGISNTSSVTVLQSSGSCYMAVITGSKGKLAVKIGSDWVSPEGFSDSDIAQSGESYCIWVKAEGYTPDPVDPVDPTPSDEPALYMIGSFNGWSTSVGLPLETEYGQYALRNQKFESETYFSFCTKLGANWDAVNAGTRYCPTSKNLQVETGKKYDSQTSSTSNSWVIAPGNYDFIVDAKDFSLTVYPAGSGPMTEDVVYLCGHVNGNTWDPAQGVKIVKNDSGIHSISEVTISNADNGYGYFSFSRALGSSWDVMNAADRYGAPSDNTLVTLDNPMSVTTYVGGGNASGCKSWKLAAGKYNMDLNLSTKKLTVSKYVDPTGIEGIESDDEVTPVYFNLQGVKVDNPSNGIYIKVTGKKTEKVIVR